MDIKKIKYNGQRVLIEYEVKRPGAGEPDKFTLDSSDKPAPDFIQAMEGLRWPLLVECELTEAVASVAPVTVRGVSLSYSEDSGLGAVITGLITLKNSNAPLVLNSPHKTEKGTFEGDTKTLGDEARDAIAALERAALGYIKGDRAQMSLDFGPAKVA